LQTYGRGITDAGVKHLKQIRRLTYLEVGASRITPVGEAELHAALPSCEIVRGTPCPILQFP